MKRLLLLLIAVLSLNAGIKAEEPYYSNTWMGTDSSNKKASLGNFLGWLGFEMVAAKPKLIFYDQLLLWCFRNQ